MNEFLNRMIHSIIIINPQWLLAVIALKMLIASKVHKLFSFQILTNFSCLGNCVCNQGFLGNGHDCRMICAMNEMFNGEGCVKLQGIEEGKKSFLSISF